MPNIIRTAGSVESTAAGSSYTDIAGAYMDYDGATYAQFGAKGPGSLGVKIRGVLAGVALTYLTFASAGAATFGYKVQAPAFAVGGAVGTVANLSDNVYGIAAVSTGGVRQDLIVASFASGGALHFNYATGSYAAPGPVGAGDTIMSIGARAWDGTNFTASSVAIQGFADQSSAGKSYVQSYLTLETTPGAAGLRYVGFFLDQNGNIGVGQNRFSAGTRPTALLQLIGGNILVGNGVVVQDATLNLNVPAGHIASVNCYRAGTGKWSFGMGAQTGSDNFEMANLVLGTAAFTVTAANNITTFNYNVNMATGTTLVADAITATSAMAFTLSGAGATAVDRGNAASTGYIQDKFSNSGNTAYFGIENSAGAGIFAGSAAYAVVLGTTSARSVQIFTNNAKVVTFASGGATTFVGAVAMGGALTGVTTMTTSSTINGQTISSAANFTGSMALAGVLTQNKPSLSGSTTASVSGGATTIATFHAGTSGIFFISGNDGTNYFLDVFASVDGAGAPVPGLQLTLLGAPAGRAYTNPGSGNLKVAMAAGTYNVMVSAVTFPNS